MYNTNFACTELEKSMREIDSEAMAAKNDKLILEKLVLEQEHAMLRYASKVTGKYISKSDDEWSIALLAFTHAIPCCCCKSSC